MSEHIKPYTMGNAKKFNLRIVPTLTNGAIPELAIDAYPGLAKEVTSDEFTKAIFTFQEDYGLDCDGKLGRGTWNALLCEYDTVDTASNYIVMDGRRIQLPDTDSYTVISFDELKSEDGTSSIQPLDLHSEGHFSRRKKDIGQVIMHWGGLNPVHLHTVMSSGRKVSTHFGIGLVDGLPVVMQYLDLKHKAWHAGWGNTGSIGVDICQQPSLKWIGHYQKKGYDVKRCKNPTDRGDKNIISLEPRIREATKDFVQDLMEALNIPLVDPGTSAVLAKEDIVNHTYTLIGHHHLVKKKWDIACWWDDIFTA